MSTPTTPLANVAVAKKPTFLTRAGEFFRNLLHIGEEAATIAEPIVDIEFPAIAPLYNTTLGLAVGAEALLGTASGQGPQKLAAVLPQLLAAAKMWAKQNSIDWDDADIEKWASATIDTLNLVPGFSNGPAKTS